MSLPSSDLFRREVVERRRTRLEGSILLPAHPSLTLAAAASGALLLVFAALLAFGTYTRKARLEGIVMPRQGVINVVAPAAARVEAVLVAEGASVRRGDVLCRLTSERYDAQGVGAAASVRASLEKERQTIAVESEREALSGQAEIEGLRRRQEGLRSERAAAERAVAHVQRQCELARDSLEQLRELARQGLASRAELLERESQLAATEARREEVRQQHGRLERELRGLPIEIERARLAGSSRLLELERQAQRVAQQLTEASTGGAAVALAPIDGTVGAVVARPGEPAAAGQLLLNVVPAGSELVVELYAGSRAVGFLKAGQPVVLRFDAFPHEKFGVQRGRVREVGSVALAPADALSHGFLPLRDREAPYRVLVELAKPSVTAYGREEPLRPGMTVTANVELDSRRLHEWLLEPLWSLRGRI
jgi:membrane fusion protein